MTIAFLFILGFVNVLYANPKFGLDRSRDITKDKTNTLAPETMSALQALPGKVTATAFFSASDPTSATELLNKIRNNSNGKFDYKFVNPDLDLRQPRMPGLPVMEKFCCKWVINR